MATVYTLILGIIIVAVVVWALVRQFKKERYYSIVESPESFVTQLKFRKEQPVAQPVKSAEKTAAAPLKAKPIEPVLRAEPPVKTVLKKQEPTISLAVAQAKATALLAKKAAEQQRIVVTQAAQSPTLESAKPVEKTIAVIGDEQPKPLALSEEDVFVQSVISKAQQDSVAILQGEPHQAEISFEDAEKPTWDTLVKESFEKRVQKPTTQVAAPVEEKKPVESLVITKPEPLSELPLQLAVESIAPVSKPKETVKLPSPLLMIYIMAPRARSFSGAAILNACSRKGLKHGDHEVFHSYAINGKILFSVASVVKPWIFPLAQMDTFRTPGLSVVMDMELLEHPRAVFKAMLETANDIAQDLGGDLLDDRQERLTALTASDYLARIKTYHSLREHHERSEA